MVQNLNSHAEKMAEKAEELRTFSGMKLLHIKKQVEILLQHIGDYGIFSGYTKHDISHIDEMLKIAEWIIPENTKKVMTAAEWMMLVLSIYFHDMGMLVTKEEYDNREKTEFVEFKKSAYEGKYGKEYIKKIECLEEPDKFLYEEYVRMNHAKRIKMWIIGDIDESFGFTERIMNEIQKLMASIDSFFRQDLAIVCESHHLDNLYDYTIYDTNKCYESSNEGKVNLQYIAVILRTVDLLHITMDRTPAIEYRVFSPTDPISILEWQKQMAIRAVKPMEMRDKEDNVDKTIQSDTISITAYFGEANEAEAFFALTAYLKYVRQELRTSYDWIQSSMKKQGTKDYLFPWKEIDDKGIKTKNFSDHLLKFELDQSSILQLLVGHTLYNDSSVVIRELVQNGLDAIKLQNEIEKQSEKTITKGKIVVSWNDTDNILEFSDNGTGMTVFDIENYLLKVGTSKYSSASFMKEHPDFVSISRFGIGILTCFLVADDIEIVTCSSENNEANRIFFRNVDGKYLLKTVQKQELPEHIKEHGTHIKLHLRDKDTVKRLEYNLRKWVVFPKSEVYLIMNGSDPIKIGYDSPKQALEDYLENGTNLMGNIKVEQVEVDGITLAYALRYREYFQEYSLVEFSRRNYVNDNYENPIPIGVCFEGVRVADNTPGYRRDCFLAIMDSNNNKVVKTNVARSSVEDNEGKNELLRIIYTMYKRHVEGQMESFKEKGKSLSWISSEIKFLVNQLVNISNPGVYSNVLEKKEIFEEIFGELEAILYENKGKRQLVSVNFLQNLNHINMVESNMINAAEHLLKETKSNMSLEGLMNTITETEEFKGMDMVCDYSQSNLLYTMALKGKTVVQININKEDKKIDIGFSQGEEKWYKIQPINADTYSQYSTVYIPKDGGGEINGITEDEFGVKTELGVFLINDNEVTRYICEKRKLFNIDESKSEELAFRAFISLIVNKQNTFISRERGQEFFSKSFQNRIEREVFERVSEGIKDIVWSKIDRNELINILFTQKISIYDLNDWSRRDLL